MAERQNRQKFLEARVIFLELLARAPRLSAAPPAGFGGKAAIIARAENCPPHFYRYLYEQVGRPHHWEMRRSQSDAALAAILHAENTILHILYCGFCPAGFAETHLSEKDGKRAAELIYFGLIPDYQGKGLARFFLSEVLQAAWAAGADKIITQTNSLDSPRALQLYQQAGFTPTATANARIKAWD